jgi:hypothetical protein
MSEGMSEKHQSEETGINIENEFSLHNSLKEWFSEPGDRFEAKVGRHIADILRGNEIIEIQTRNFSSIRPKIKALVKKHPVTLIHPIAAERWLVYMDGNGALNERRKSNKRGKPKDIFEEMVYMPTIINHPNFTLKIAMTREEEVRKRDGKGAWRRKRISIINRKLLDVFDVLEFNHCSDFLRFIPDELEDGFTNKQLAQALGISQREATRMTWCLRKMQAIRVFWKDRNTHLHERIIDGQDWEPDR